MAAAGTAALAWGIYWIAIDGEPHGPKTSTGMQPGYNTQTPGLILAGAGTAAIGGAVLLFLTGHRPTDSTVAIGLTPNSVLLGGNF